MKCFEGVVRVVMKCLDGALLNSMGGRCLRTVNEGGDISISCYCLAFSSLEPMYSYPINC